MARPKHCLNFRDGQSDRYASGVELTPIGKRGRAIRGTVRRAARRGARVEGDTSASAPAAAAAAARLNRTMACVRSITS
jgi:hypothetical protein